MSSASAAPAPGLAAPSQGARAAPPPALPLPTAARLAEGSLAQPHGAVALGSARSQYPPPGYGQPPSPPYHQTRQDSHQMASPRMQQMAGDQMPSPRMQQMAGDQMASPRMQQMAGAPMQCKAPLNVAPHRGPPPPPHQVPPPQYAPGSYHDYGMDYAPRQAQGWR